MNRRQQRALKSFITVMAVSILGYIVGPPLHWHVTEALASVRRRGSSVSCPPCRCDCSSQPLLSLGDELINTFTDCVKHDPEVSEEMEKSFTELLMEEVRLREAQALENQQRADIRLLEAKKMASQYQKEADKCSSGMETCEEARERAEATLEEQRRVTAMWELRARQRGWQEGFQ
ncbi:hypothetical protein BT93_D0707 [Corymbia citriodora subsp. variegata]|nr:hypothetical protein BT93_D0707 [Corymbia citriodora subsp. variegata]KAF8031569.1 hypothetical protein BT93_D0707 [Corymbia citriodora subsp. variegata]